MPRETTGMRVAIVSDIHGNLTAFEAVLSDLKEIALDLDREDASVIVSTIAIKKRSS
jgi:Icc-related predicted phosphoesterase